MPLSRSAENCVSTVAMVGTVRMTSSFSQTYGSSSGFSGSRPNPTDKAYRKLSRSEYEKRAATARIACNCSMVTAMEVSPVSYRWSARCTTGDSVQIGAVDAGILSGALNHVDQHRPDGSGIFHLVDRRTAVPPLGDRHDSIAGFDDASADAGGFSAGEPRHDRRNPAWVAAPLLFLCVFAKAFGEACIGDGCDRIDRDAVTAKLARSDDRERGDPGLGGAI